jgi:hypothetical protein
MHDAENPDGWGTRVRRVDNPVHFQTYISGEVTRVVRKVATLNGMSFATVTERLLRRALGLPTSPRIDEAVAHWRDSE